jgi:hypothetical protein
MSAVDLGRPLLQREPDGRRAPTSIFGDSTPIYLALMLGVPIATLTVLWNTLLVRRFGRALCALVLGAVGSLGNTLLFGVLLASDAGAIALFATQLVAIAIGALLYGLQRPVVRGHCLLQGPTFSPAPILFGALAVQFFAFRALVYLHHPLFVLGLLG